MEMHTSWATHSTVVREERLPSWQTIAALLQQAPVGKLLERVSLRAYDALRDDTTSLRARGLVVTPRRPRARGLVVTPRRELAS